MNILYFLGKAQWALAPQTSDAFLATKIYKRGVSDELVKISKLRGATLPKIEYFLILKQY